MRNIPLAGRRWRVRGPQDRMWCQMRGRFQMVARALLAAITIAGLALTTGPAYAQSPASGGAQNGLAAPIRISASAVVGQSPSGRHKVTYVVRADIDGHSRLILSGRSARWFHIDFAAPGRHEGKNNPTIINGTKWFPMWPHTGENRDCHCHSSTFRKVMPRVPQKADGFFFKAVSCRDSCSVGYSDGVLVVDFNDNPSFGDVWYKVKITLTVEH